MKTCMPLATLFLFSIMSCEKSVDGDNGGLRNQNYSGNTAALVMIVDKATNSERSISKVEFIVDGNTVAVDSEPPFQYDRNTGGRGRISYRIEYSDGTSSMSEESDLKPLTSMINYNTTTIDDSIFVFLNWCEVDGNNQNLQVSLNKEFTMLVYNGTNPDGKFRLKLNKNAKYYYRIRAQNIQLEWMEWSAERIVSFDAHFPKAFGGVSDDFANSIIKTAQSDFVFCGYSASYGAGNMWLFKVNGNGDSVWSRSYDEGGYETATSVKECTDGGFVIGGYVITGTEQAALIKTDAAGNKLWSKSFGGANDDIFRSVEITNDGSFICVGYTYSNSLGGGDGWIVKLNSYGDTVWTKRYATVSDEGFTSIVSLHNGTYVITGYAFRSVEYDAWVLKIDEGGNQIFSKFFGTTAREWAGNIAQTSDNGFIVGGQTYSGAGSSDLYYIKIDSLGNEKWAKKFGTTGYDLTQFVGQNAMGNLYIGGYIQTAFNGYDFLFIKTDTEGNIVFEKQYGGIGNDVMNAGVVSGTDCIFAGSTTSFGSGGKDAYLVRVDKEGNPF